MALKKKKLKIPRDGAEDQKNEKKLIFRLTERWRWRWKMKNYDFYSNFNFFSIFHRISVQKFLLTFLQHKSARMIEQKVSKIVAIGIDSGLLAQARRSKERKRLKRPESCLTFRNCHGAACDWKEKWKILQLFRKIFPSSYSNFQS